MIINIKNFVLLLSLIGCNAVNCESFDYYELMQNSEKIDSECIKISDLMTNIVVLFHEMGDCVSLQCQIHLQKAADHLKKVFDGYIAENLQKYLQNIESVRASLIDINEQQTSSKNSFNNDKCINNNNNNHDPNTAMIISAIRSKDYCSIDQLLQNGIPQYKDLINDVYDSLRNAENLVEFFYFLNNIEDQLLCYRLLFDEMIKKGHQYSSLSASIAYQVLNVFSKTLPNNENYIHLHKKLPDSLKQLPWTKTLNIINVKRTDAALLSAGQFDSKRKNVVMYSHLSTCGADCHWILIPVTNSTSFYIKNNYYNEFLFADSKEFDVKKKYRLVFSSSTVINENTSRWELEPIKGSKYFKIKNVQWQEYLYVEDGFFNIEFSNRNQVFTTMHSGIKYDGCKWEIVKRE